ncbi:hypothetical protein ES708_27661 [subsurface metagenome]
MSHPFPLFLDLLSLQDPESPALRSIPHFLPAGESIELMILKQENGVDVWISISSSLRVGESLRHCQVKDPPVFIPHVSDPKVPIVSNFLPRLFQTAQMGIECESNKKKRACRAFFRNPLDEIDLSPPAVSENPVFYPIA